MTETNDTIEAIRDIAESGMTDRLKVISIQAILDVTDSTEDAAQLIDLGREIDVINRTSVSVVRTDELRELQRVLSLQSQQDAANKIGDVILNHAYLIGR